MAPPQLSVEKKILTPDAALKQMTTQKNNVGEVTGITLIVKLFDAKDTYLVVTLPKQAVDELVAYIGTLPPGDRRAAVNDWLEKNRLAVQQKYDGSQKHFTLDVVPVASSIGATPRKVETPTSMPQPAPTSRPTTAPKVEEDVPRPITIADFPLPKQVKTVYVEEGHRKIVDGRTSRSAYRAVLGEQRADSGLGSQGFEAPMGVRITTLGSNTVWTWVNFSFTASQLLPENRDKVINEMISIGVASVYHRIMEGGEIPTGDPKQEQVINSSVVTAARGIYDIARRNAIAIAWGTEDKKLLGYLKPTETELKAAPKIWEEIKP